MCWLLSIKKKIKSQQLHKWLAGMRFAPENLADSEGKGKCSVINERVFGFHLVVDIFIVDRGQSLNGMWYKIHWKHSLHHFLLFNQNYILILLACSCLFVWYSRLHCPFLALWLTWLNLLIPFHLSIHTVMLVFLWDFFLFFHDHILLSYIYGK